MPHGFPVGTGPVATIVQSSGMPSNAWPAFVAAIAAVVVICAVAIIIRRWFWPHAASGGQKGLCPECGYDLRASPEQCPECGTRRRDATPVPGKPSRVLWSVRFQAGDDVLDVPIWRELMSTVDAICREQPGGADMLFAATGTDGNAIVTSDELRRAGQCIMDLVDSRRRELLCASTVATIARRARQFARQHPYARVHRTVTRRPA